MAGLSGSRRYALRRGCTTNRGSLRYIPAPFEERRFQIEVGGVHPLFALRTTHEADFHPEQVKNRLKISNSERPDILPDVLLYTSVQGFNTTNAYFTHRRKRL